MTRSDFLHITAAAPGFTRTDQTLLWNQSSTATVTEGSKGIRLTTPSPSPPIGPTGKQLAVQHKHIKHPHHRKYSCQRSHFSPFLQFPASFQLSLSENIGNKLVVSSDRLPWNITEQKDILLYLRTFFNFRFIWPIKVCRPHHWFHRPSTKQSSLGHMVTLLYKFGSLTHGFKHVGWEQKPGGGQRSPWLLSKFLGAVPVHQPRFKILSFSDFHFKFRAS